MYLCMRIRIFIREGMRKIGEWTLILLAVCGMCSCHSLQRHHQADAVAELDGKYLSEGDILALTAGHTPEDSARIAREYIEQWATDILVYSEAGEHTDKAIEALVEDYRRSLYVHQYEQKLVAKRMPKAVDDALVDSFYRAHEDRFTLRECIVRGLLLVVPIDAPKLDKLRKNLAGWSEEIQPEIENYAYQYATGYEYFVSDWKSASQLLLSMPFERNDLMQKLKDTKQIELRDSTSTYILQVTDKHLAGEPMPIDYARVEIEKVILTQRQVSFLETERRKLLKKAINNKRLIIKNDTEDDDV